MAKTEVQEQLQEESKKLIEYYRDVAKGVAEGAKPTARQQRAIEALKSGAIEVGNATILFSPEGAEGADAKYAPDSSTPPEVAFDPKVHSGSASYSEVIKNLGRKRDVFKRH